MNILDENILEPQRQVLLKWGVSFRQIGFEVGRKGMKDTEIIPFLISLNHPTFFTLDADFCRKSLCHSRYCLVFLNVGEDEAPAYVRRLLHHPRFSTQARRMGTVIRISATGLSVFYMHALAEEHFPWPGIAGQAAGSAIREDAASYTVEEFETLRHPESLQTSEV
jgi:hypothetical protein